MTEGAARLNSWLLTPSLVRSLLTSSRDKPPENLFLSLEIADFCLLESLADKGNSPILSRYSSSDGNFVINGLSGT